ncbi:MULTISPECIES: helix-turn-helix transcriptional regulator [Microbacterium]|uniref:helix-turn-helix transcriptional regulator n=1 Tax=Microbacterium TaxID=33882 RepID=UPI000E75FBCD|nr:MULTISPECIES: WYL domain-containing protein [Microbacterium]RKE63063.1 proteasome accessory factor B [Microbacterium sp. AG238]WJM14326.1 WYL domain-containing protein [Microbacterium arborescens]
MSVTPARVPPEERLVNLVVALMATEQGVTKDTILGSVSGYREQVESGSRREALEKMFERDKENLRGLGVPIETIGDYADPDDLREARYRIPPTEYELPADITFTPAELAVLTLAGGVWGEHTLSAGARSGLRKIRSLGIDVDEPIIGFAPRLDLHDASFLPLQRAIEQAREVEFDYLRPGSDRPRRRRVRPFALVEFEARWHLFGWDTGVEAERTFLLSRVLSDVVVTRQGFDESLRVGAGERALSGLRDVALRQNATVTAVPGTEAELRLRRRARAEATNGRQVEIPFVDLEVFADELASYGPEVMVLEPRALQDAVMRRLRAARDRSAESA